MATTKTMCHHTLTWFRNATSLMPATLRTISMSDEDAIVETREMAF